jgi:hypothetical protein
MHRSILTAVVYAKTVSTAHCEAALILFQVYSRQVSVEIFRHKLTVHIAQSTGAPQALMGCSKRFLLFSSLTVNESAANFVIQGTLL